MNDNLGDRMKMFEMAEAGRKLMPCLPCIARLDGKAFHTFTKGLDRPYDIKLSSLMVDTTKYLVSESNACCGYTQSDEITLAWYSTDINSQIFFDGRISKMTSVLASMCSVFFNRNMPLGWTGKSYPLFDCRVWNVPNTTEGANAFLWREYDATKNSISMAARNFYSHKELYGKNGSEMQEMLFAKGVNFNDYPDFFKRGTYIQRKKLSIPFTSKEIEKLPAKHEARLNPDLRVERTEFVILNMPPLSKVTNRVEVIFNGADPKLEN